MNSRHSVMITISTPRSSATTLYRRLPHLVAFFVLVLLPQSSASLHAQEITWKHETSLPDSLSGYLALEAANADTMLALGVGGFLSYQHIYRSIDGGKTWQTVYRDSFDVETRRAPLVLYDLAFPTPRLALVIADKGSALRSRDGGTTWERIRVIPNDTNWSGDPISSLVMSDDQHGATFFRPARERAGEDTVQIRRTLDGGDHWTEVPLSLPEEWKVYGIETIGTFAPGNYLIYTTRATSGTEANHMLAVTTDDGTSWDTFESRFPFGEHPARYPSFHPVDSLRGYFAGTYPKRFHGGDTIGLAGFLAYTEDGGKTWQTRYDGFLNGLPVSGINDITFADENHAVMVGSGGFHRTTDGGKTWIQDSIHNRARGQAHIAKPDGHEGICLYISGEIFLAEALSSVEADREDRGYWQISPNPVQGDNALIEVYLVDPTTLCIEVFDVLGRVHYSLSEQRESGLYQRRIPVAELYPGVYTVAISINSVQYSTKLIVK